MQVLPTSRQVPSHLLFYEDLLTNPLHEYYKLAAFIGVNPSLEEMAKVVGATSADAMRGEEQSFNFSAPHAPGAKKPQTFAMSTNAKQSHGYAMVQSASESGWRGRLSADTVTKAEQDIMQPVLHPALWWRWVESRDPGRRER